MIEKSPQFNKTSRLKSRTGIIDLHIHTNSSFGVEHNKMGITPVQVLSDMAHFANQTNQHVTISITDHNNFCDLKQVVSEMNENPQDYKNITFLTGCEFSVTPDSFGKFARLDNRGQKEVVNLCPSFHMLAYNFDLNDPKLNFYVSLLDDTKHFFKRESINFPYGTLILITRKFLKKYNIKLDLLDFKDFKFDYSIKVTENLKNLINYTLSLNYNKKLVSEILPDTQKFETDLLHYAGCTVNLAKSKYLDVMELMECVENAGGFCVLAHPALLHLSLAKPKLMDMSFNENKKYQKFKTRFDLLEHCINKMCNPNITKQNGEKLKGIIGIELYHKDCLSERYFKKLCNYVEKYNFYVTAGSDTHFNLTPNTTAGAVIAKSVEAYTKYLYNLPKSYDSNYAVTKLQLIDDLKNNVEIVRNENNQLDYNIVECNANGNEIISQNKLNQYLDIINEYSKKKYEQENNNQQDGQQEKNKVYDENYYIEKCIFNLKVLCERYKNNIVNIKDARKQASAYFMLNNFRYCINRMKDHIKSDLTQNEEYVQLIKHNQELKEKLYNNKEFKAEVERHIKKEMKNADQQKKKLLEKIYEI